MRAAERGHILFRLVELMKQHSDEIAALESLDAGNASTWGIHVR